LKVTTDDIDTGYLILDTGCWINPDIKYCFFFLSSIKHRISEKYGPSNKN
jgi:hypothetical protein